MSESTDFSTILNRFYNRIEKDEKFFNYYNIDVNEAIQIATQRATNYLIESLDDLSMVGNLQVDFSDYDEEVQEINFKLLTKEMNLIVEMMFLKYMKRDEALLHAMEINFTPSDLSVFSLLMSVRAIVILLENSQMQSKLKLTIIRIEIGSQMH